jgi:hypothetical protein
MLNEYEQFFESKKFELKLFVTRIIKIIYQQENE